MYVKAFKDGSKGSTFQIPAYFVSQSQSVVLDGNHRLAALMLTSVPFCVHVYEVLGPSDPSCLLDLSTLAKKDLGREGIVR